ncbi:transcription termination factor MTERF4, chloroplastic-like [Phalaenopsis equestris]|uniref:transcription termination factor MTERF4, chloroplastic-like n=1 Tax=Phalaenopsis equestris TaxID=78828 RepID=UPI0009E26B0B|nr:transcription termination factor MTERF4, chloroplastic-like [Phalaenopsis equestris]
MQNAFSQTLIYFSLSAASESHRLVRVSSTCVFRRNPQMRRLLRFPFILSNALNQSCLKNLRLLHEAASKTLKASVSDINVSYLVGSCGLSPSAALKTSKKFTLKATGNSDSFLSLLRSHGFTQTQIANIVTSYPTLLNFNPEKIIKPKLQFFLSAGFSNADLVKFISNDPHILNFSLENMIKPNFQMLKSILGSDREVDIAIRNSSRLLRIRLDKVMLPNMKTLRDIGVPPHNIVKLATFHPRSMMKSPAHFTESVDLLKTIGFDASKPLFTLGINALSVLSKSSWAKKLDFYGRFGWSEKDTLSAFKKYPYCMSYSEEKIKQTMVFFVEKLKFDPSSVAERPVLLSFSFEKRVAPRHKIFCMLASKGLTKKNMDFRTFLIVPEKKFIDNYVTRYACQVPEVLILYKDKLELLGCKVEH